MWGEKEKEKILIIKRTTKPPHKIIIILYVILYRQEMLIPNTLRKLPPCKEVMRMLKIN